ncbi:deoxyribodipyrimidine photo-lyase [Glutamicibacter sp. M10]|uniref:deoxyribodipyrimidine photo-lyase n=1 Tax=Glutamicibacter sp. M10 TaxID=3023076 RepID=UPI0029055DC5|nr:deoxyribodipyrimidine photo-lyase [Glutamicibacter sp. M10]
MNPSHSLTSAQGCQLVLFRDDLRTADHPALLAASAMGPVVGLYILDESSPGIRPLGGAARWWLHHALLSLRASLKELGIPLLLRRGRTVQVLDDVIAHGAVAGVHFNRRYGHAERAVDAELESSMRKARIPAHSYAGSLLHEPWELLTQSGTGYKVFTPSIRHYATPRFALPSPRLPHNPCRRASCHSTKSCRAGSYCRPLRIGLRAWLKRGRQANQQPTSAWPWCVIRSRKTIRISMIDRTSTGPPRCLRPCVGDTSARTRYGTSSVCWRAAPRGSLRVRWLCAAKLRGGISAGISTTTIQKCPPKICA